MLTDKVYHFQMLNELNVWLEEFNCGKKQGECVVFVQIIPVQNMVAYFVHVKREA